MGGKRVDILGQQFGLLTVIGKTNNPLRWTARCSCGNTRDDLKTNALRRGMIKSCGCLLPGIQVGDKFGSRTVIKILVDGQLYLCRCDCGNELEYVKSTLRNKRVQYYCQSCRSNAWQIPTQKAVNREMIRRYKSGATERGLEFSLSENECFNLFFGICFYCDSPPLRECKLKDGRTLNTSGIDRLDSGLGYVQGNVVSSCSICNYAKNAFTLEEFYEWMDRIVEKRSREQ